jgi:hypothetical protein
MFCNLWCACWRRRVIVLVEEALLSSATKEWGGGASHGVFYNGFITNRLGLFCLFVLSSVVLVMKLQRKWNLFIGGWLLSVLEWGCREGFLVLVGKKSSMWYYCWFLRSSHLGGLNMQDDNSLQFSTLHIHA